MYLFRDRVSARKKQTWRERLIYISTCLFFKFLVFRNCRFRDGQWVGEITEILLHAQFLLSILNGQSFHGGYFNDKSNLDMSHSHEIQTLTDIYFFSVVYSSNAKASWCPCMVSIRQCPSSFTNIDIISKTECFTCSLKEDKPIFIIKFTNDHNDFSSFIFQVQSYFLEKSLQTGR